MGAFFPHSRGIVKRVQGPHTPSPFYVALAGDSTPFRAGIITQVGVRQEGNFQFLQTLDDTIFLYVFGNKIGEIRLAGMAFSESCDAQGTIGSDEVLDFYDENKISNQAEPVIVGLGPRRKFNGFLTGMQFDVADPELQIGQWSYRFHSFPSR